MSNANMEIKLKLVEHQMTLGQLAEILGKPRQVLSNIINGYELAPEVKAEILKKIERGN